jgi:hypothetical protein
MTQKRTEVVLTFRLSTIAKASATKSQRDSHEATEGTYDDQHDLRQNETTPNLRLCDSTEATIGSILDGNMDVGQCQLNPGFIKVHCCSSPVELEAILLMEPWQRETIPKIWFSLDHIKAKVERDLGSSNDMEWWDLFGWRPLTDIHELAFLHRRYQNFQTAFVLAIRSPSKYDFTHSGPTFVKVHCCSSPIELEAVQNMDQCQKDAIPRTLLDLSHIRAKLEHDLGSSRNMEYFNVFQWKPLTDVRALAHFQRYEKFAHMSVIPIRVPAKYSLVHPRPTYVKIHCCSSPIAYDQLRSMKRHDREAIPPVLFDWDHIKAKVEHDLGSTTGMEYHNLEWKPLTDLHALDLYQRYETFQFMLVVPIRLPSQYGSINPGPGYVKVCCCSSPIELEAIEFMDQSQKEAIRLVLFDWEHIKAKVEHDLGSSRDMEYYWTGAWHPLTDLHVLTISRRYAILPTMHIVPIRLSSKYSAIGNGGFSPVKLEALEHMDNGPTESTPKISEGRLNALRHLCSCLLAFWFKLKQKHPIDAERSVPFIFHAVICAVKGAGAMKSGSIAMVLNIYWDFRYSLYPHFNWYNQTIYIYGTNDFAK